MYRRAAVPYPEGSQKETYLSPRNRPASRSVMFLCGQATATTILDRFPFGRSAPPGANHERRAFFMRACAPGCELSAGGALRPNGNRYKVR